MNDGISLNNIQHPKQNLLKRFLFLFKKNHINPKSLEVIEIEIKKASEK